jgi:hypothetical protein
VFADEERQQASQTGDPDASESVDQAARGGEDTNPAEGTPPIDDAGQQSGQTQAPAPEDDVGVPEDVEDRTE